MERTVSVREGSIEDYPRIREVAAETLAFHRRSLPQVFQNTDSPSPSLEFVAQILEEGALFLAECEQTTVGLLTVRVVRAHDVPFLVPRRYAVVDAIGITADYQRRGVGQSLMHAAEAWARDHDLHEIQLNVWEFNEAAIAFYERQGYETASRLMWKQL